MSNQTKTNWKAKWKNPNYHKEWREKNRDKYNATRRQNRRKVRIEVLTHYGGEPPYCACCGEKQTEFLCIDHVNPGAGSQQRRESGGGSILLCEWLKKNRFPLGYRVLCHNCNSAIGFYGYCPHQRANKEETQ